MTKNRYLKIRLKSNDIKSIWNTETSRIYNKENDIKESSRNRNRKNKRDILTEIEETERKRERDDWKGCPLFVYQGSKEAILLSPAICVVLLSFRQIIYFFGN
jgi:ribosomal 30S subunit maturation factor RimM